MPETTTPSPDELSISPEVAWYLESRNIPLPDCPPKFKTPEPRDVPGARFDADRVDQVIKVFSLLRHTQGQWAGRPLMPDPWQIAYILAPIFGWVRRNSDNEWVRIIRKAYVDIPRKNGKTTTAGGVAICLTTADDEPGAQVIAAAAGKDQARYCFDPIKAIAEKSPALSPHVKAMASKIVHKRSGSYFQVVANVADLLHGANVHGAVVDELHVHKTPELLDAIESGTGSRRQPLVLIITTADDGRQATVYALRRKRIEQLASGVLVDETMYGVVWAADPEDDPFLEETWRKANPGYGISPTREFMASEAKQAQDSPANLARFLRLHLGIRTKQETKYLDLAAWDRNASIVDEEALKGRTCFGGLDLSSTADLTALCWAFPAEIGFDFLWRLWLPEAAVDELDKRTANLASAWVRAGWLTTTPGNVVDYDFIRQTVNDDREKFEAVEIAYDPWNATQLVTDLTNDEATMVPMRQGFVSMSAPTKELQRLILEGTAERPVLRHGGNPAVRWQVDNFAAAMDPAGNVKPDKARAGDKIDGLVAAVMAIARATAHRDATSSIYEDRGVIVV